jgi:hypothetical protein
MTCLDRLPAEQRHFADNIAKMLLRGELEAFVSDGARRCGFKDDQIRLLLDAAREIAGPDLPIPEIRRPWSAAESEAAAQEILTGVQTVRIASRGPAAAAPAMSRQPTVAAPKTSQVDEYESARKPENIAFAIGFIAGPVFWTVGTHLIRPSWPWWICGVIGLVLGGVMWLGVQSYITGLIAYPERHPRWRLERFRDTCCRIGTTLTALISLVAYLIGRMLVG